MALIIGLACLPLLPAGATAPPARHAGMSVLSSVPVHQQAVALTIDLGESATRASATALLIWLDDRHLHATFFITGWFVRTYPDLTRLIAAHGHDLGNHTDTHPHCRRIGTERLKTELRHVEELLQRQGLAVSEPRYFRPPFGEYDDHVVSAAAELGYRTVMWSATTVDYVQRGDAARAANAVVRQVRPGGIILTHATPVSAAMVPQVVRALQARGYSILTLGELVRLGQPPPPAPATPIAKAPAGGTQSARLGSVQALWRRWFGARP